MKYQALILCCFLVLSAGFGWLFSWLVSYVLSSIIAENSSLFWLARFINTVSDYGTIFLPFFVLIHFTKKHNLHNQDGCHSAILRLIVTGNTSETKFGHSDVSYSPADPSETPLYKKTIHLIVCILGLQVSYLTWGVLQEKTITQEYVDSEGHTEKFTDSEFLVFMNRVLAFIFSGIYLLLKEQNVHQTPLYKYSFCSVSNILSSWCQYEALKFVSFPTQVLAKSAKVILVMIMGKLMSNTKYKNYEYFTAVLISFGMTIFLMGSTDDNLENQATTASGITLLIAYLLFDSFTANWQNSVFKEHHPSSIQMMCGVNFMSSLLTVTSLIEQGGVYYSLNFASRFPLFIIDCTLTALASAIGQLFIFATVAKFGPVIFTIIMTFRQALSILLSCLLYGHSLSASAIVGVIIVFFAIFLRIYYGQRVKKAKDLTVDNLSKS